ncbi:type IV pilus modification protein PilV [Kushneria sp. Sum13]|uniref:type IV pilus modification protein PilV n=1 Tax=Kushneria sp. Sum13 TaxID=3459196 RepID=UPI004045A901
MMSHTCVPAQRGFSLLEVLVAMVVLSLGAMGVMGLVLHAQQANEQALQRGRATLLVNDMLERLRANATREAMAVYNVGERANAPIGDQQQQGGSDCRQMNCDSQALARFDLADWEHQLMQAQGEHRRLDGLPQAHACISVTTQAQRFDATVTLAWYGTGMGHHGDGICGSANITSARQSVTASSRYSPGRG